MVCPNCSKINALTNENTHTVDGQHPLRTTSKPWLKPIVSWYLITLGHRIQKSGFPGCLRGFRNHPQYHKQISDASQCHLTSGQVVPSVQSQAIHVAPTIGPQHTHMTSGSQFALPLCPPDLRWAEVRRIRSLRGSRGTRVVQSHLGCLEDRKSLGICFFLEKNGGKDVQ